MTRREFEVYRSCQRVSAVTIADALLWFLVYEARFLRQWAP